jgi:hypothetical protein
MFENVQLFSHLHFKIAKSAIMTLKKLEPKNYANFEYFRFCAFFRGVLLITFFRGISESRYQQI